MKVRPSKPVKSNPVEPPPVKGTAQNLLYDLQQLSFYLLNENSNTRVLRKPASMEEGVKVKGGASENYKRMGRFGSMVYYHVIGDKENYNKFRQQTLNFIRDERDRGHMGGEQGCSQPHDGMHLGATFLAHLHGTLINDIELLQETGWWIGSYLAICKECYHPSYPRWAVPGFRCKGDPFSEVRDIICYHCIKDLPLDKINLKRDSWRDKVSWQRMYLPVKLAVHLKSINAIPKPGTIPKLYAPMKVNKAANGLEISIDVPENTSGKSETVDRIEIDNGVLSYSKRDGTEITLDKEV